MKIGYSILLSELIDAELVEYGDCKTFQIVCSNCREPIFKAVRQGATTAQTDQIHYLSHYEKSKAYAAECELRVKEITDRDKKQSNANSREQKITYFLQVLKDMVIESQFKGNHRNLENFIDQLNRQKAIKKIRDISYNMDRDNFLGKSLESVGEHFDSYISDMTEISGAFPKTSFAITVQKRIAHDFFQHLLSAQGKENFDFIFNIGYIYLVARLEQALRLPGREEWEYFLYDSMSSLIQTSKEKGLETLSRLNEYLIYPPFIPESESTLLIKLVSEIHHEMFGLLLRLPYFEWIAKNTSTELADQNSRASIHD